MVLCRDSGFYLAEGCKRHRVQPKCLNEAMKWKQEEFGARCHLDENQRPQLAATQQQLIELGWLAE